MSLQGGDADSNSTVQIKSCNLVFIGSEGVGKTTIVRQFTTGIFHADYVPTTLETTIHFHNVDDDTYRVHLCDSSGSSYFVRHRAAYLAEANGIIFVFSITDRSSLYCLMNSVEEILHTRHWYGLRTNIPLLLIGTGSDKVQQRSVTLSEVEQVSANALLRLGLRRAGGGERASNGGMCEGLPLGVSATYPVVEITCTSTFEVTRALQAMIRMVRCFSSDTDIPTADVLYSPMKISNLLFSPPAVATHRSSRSSDLVKTISVVANFDNMPFFEDDFSSSEAGKAVGGSPSSKNSVFTINSRQPVLKGEAATDNDSKIVIGRSTEAFLEGQCHREGGEREEIKQPQEENTEKSQQLQKSPVKSSTDGESTPYQSAGGAGGMCKDTSNTVERMTSYEVGFPSMKPAGKVITASRLCPPCRNM